MSGQRKLIGGPFDGRLAAEWPDKCKEVHCAHFTTDGYGYEVYKRNERGEFVYDRFERAP